MLKIFETDKNTFHAKSNSHDPDSVLIADPGLFISNFFLNSYSKFSILPIPREVKQLINEKNLHKFKLENNLKDSLIKAMTRPRYNNLDKIFEKGLNGLKEGNDVYATPNAAVLFIEWLFNKNEKIEKFECDILTDEMGIIYNSLKNECFYPIALERLFKLFMMFYHRRLEKNEISLISNFQKQLVNLEERENKEEIFNSISLESIENIKDIVKKVYKDEKNLPSINIFNKCLEELISLENKIQSDEIEILTDNFVNIKSKEDLSNNFFDMYLKVFY